MTNSEFYNAEHERDNKLHAAEILVLKRKDCCEKDLKRKISYGLAATAIHKDRTRLVENYALQRSICPSCGSEIVIDTENIFYCSRCGQRLSTQFGWTSLNYFNEGDM